MGQQRLPCWLAYPIGRYIWQSLWGEESNLAPGSRKLRCWNRAQSWVRVDVGKLNGQLTHRLVANSYDYEKVHTE